MMLFIKQERLLVGNLFVIVCHQPFIWFVVCTPGFFLFSFLQKKKEDVIHSDEVIIVWIDKCRKCHVNSHLRKIVHKKLLRSMFRL